TVVAVEEVEAEAVLALNALLRLLAGAAPVDQAKAALPQLAVDLDIGLRGSAVAGRLDTVRTRPQQRAVDVQVLGRSCLLAPNRHGGDGERRENTAAVLAGECQLQLGPVKGLRGAADDGDVDPLVRLASGASQRQKELHLRRGGRPGRCEEQREPQKTREASCIPH